MIYIEEKNVKLINEACDDCCIHNNSTKQYMLAIVCATLKLLVSFICCLYISLSLSVAYDVHDEQNETDSTLHMSRLSNDRGEFPQHTRNFII